MRDRECAKRFRIELLQRGLPAGQARRAAQELADHWEDLKQEVLDRGLSAGRAEEYAQSCLGDWHQLVAAFRSSRGNSRLLNRHPEFVFLVSPIFLFSALFAVTLLLGALIGSLAGLWEQKALLTPFGWTIIGLAVHAIHAAAIIGTQAVFCWLALRCRCGFRCAACSVIGLSIYGFFHHVTFKTPGLGSRGSLIWSYGISQDIWSWMIPLLSIAVFCLVSTRSAKAAQN
ncbi:MAG: hypothetical protein AB9869_13090 [Verrucomicrobiia bacterium]